MLTQSPAAVGTLVFSLATDADRPAIYRLRHEVYATELFQHPANDAGELTDSLDEYNSYIVVKCGGDVVGCISITPPGRRYSIDKYMDRTDLPFACDDGLHEIRLLTVRADFRTSRRGGAIAGLLVYAALKEVERCGGTRIVAIGRREVMDFYRKLGLERLGREFHSGAVVFELMTATVAGLSRTVEHFARPLKKLVPRMDWRLPSTAEAAAPCFHGGAAYERIGADFSRLDARAEIIAADVLDAWFPPAPAAVETIRRHTEWALSAAPPTHAEGLVDTIAQVRGVPSESILVGAGSSHLIYLAFREWLSTSSRVVLLDPTYGEYAHVFESVVGCSVERIALHRENDFDLDLSQLSDALRRRPDLLVLVNPNNPTGRLAPRKALEDVLRSASPETRIWVDEAYIDYVGADQSLERFAASSENVVVCKSLSKAYALSGARAAYLCGSPQLMNPLRRWNPPWPVSLPAQMAAIAALRGVEYYAERYAETRQLREELTRALLKAMPGAGAIPGEANFALILLPVDGPTSAELVERCRSRGVYLRDASNMGKALGRHAMRVAVKDGETQRRIVEVLAASIR